MWHIVWELLYLKMNYLNKVIIGTQHQVLCRTLCLIKILGGFPFSVIIVGNGEWRSIYRSSKFWRMWSTGYFLLLSGYVIISGIGIYTTDYGTRTVSAFFKLNTYLDIGTNFVITCSIIRTSNGLKSLLTSLRNLRIPSLFTGMDNYMGALHMWMLPIAVCSSLGDLLLFVPMTITSIDDWHFIPIECCNSLLILLHKVAICPLYYSILNIVGNQYLLIINDIQCFLWRLKIERATCESLTPAVKVKNKLYYNYDNNNLPDTISKPLVLTSYELRDIRIESKLTIKDLLHRIHLYYCKIHDTYYTRKLLQNYIGLPVLLLLFYSPYSMVLSMYHLAGLGGYDFINNVSTFLHVISEILLTVFLLLIPEKFKTQVRFFI